MLVANIRLDSILMMVHGNFSGPCLLVQEFVTRSIALGDINNDGNLDLIVTG